MDLAAPNGNASPFYVGLNDSFVRMTAIDNHVFRLVGLDLGFVSALTNLFNPGEVPGFLIAAYENASGGLGSEIFSLGAADAMGEFSFRTVGQSGIGALANGVRVIDFYACTADATGNCAPLNNNFSQFALDNLLVVPEPGSLALALAALALTAGFSRRRA